jgi:hypothetical protein
LPPRVWPTIAQLNGITRHIILPIIQDNLRRFAATGSTLALGDDYGNPRHSPEDANGE